MVQGVALLSMRAKNRMGLLGKAKTLNRVAPLLFRPRLRRVFFLPEAELTGFHVTLPFGPDNWQMLNAQTRAELLRQTDDLCAGFGVGQVMIPGITNRQLPGQLAPGDRFTAAMVALKLAQRVERHPCSRVVVICDRPAGLLAAGLIAERFRLPVVLQCRVPSAQEAQAMRLLYDSGIPVAVSQLKPDGWGPEDVVIALDDPEGGPTRMAGWYLDACPDSAGHAPLLEWRLASQQIPPRLGLLAPMLEARLTAGTVAAKEREIVHVIEENGSPIWYYFLDKGRRCHYNSIKG